MADDPVAPAVDPAAAPAPAPAPDPAVAARPDYLPEAYWDATANKPKAEDLTKDLTELATLRTERDAATKDIAAKPEDVKIELPENFEMPKGLEFKPDPSDPMFNDFQKLAVETKMNPAQVKGAVGLYAKMLLAQNQNAEAAVAKEMQALGAAATTRVDAAKRWLNATLPPDQAATLGYALNTKAGVEAVEKLADSLKGVTARGMPTNSDLKPKPDLEGMSAYDKLKAANAEAAAKH